MPQSPSRYKPPGTDRKTTEQSWASRRHPKRKRYNSRAWQALREQVLRRDLFQCQACGNAVMLHAPQDRPECQGHADHIIPAESEDDVMCDTVNLQTLCGPCHSAKTKYQGDRILNNRFVICGKAGTGKSTWARERAKPGDLVWDVDAIATVLFQLPTYPRPAAQASMIGAMRAKLFETLKTFTGAVYIIETEESAARQIANMIGAEVVTLECSDDERSIRLKRRGEVAAQYRAEETMERHEQETNHGR